MIFETCSLLCFVLCIPSIPGHWVATHVASGESAAEINGVRAIMRNDFIV